MNIISSEVLALAGILYISLLFYIAYRGDRADPNFVRGNSGVVYSLSLAVYCSSWTFFGAVGTASTRGWDFFAIYLGPILLFLFGYRLVQRIIIISKQQSITSISDFISSRYGKSRNIAVLVTCIAVLGSLPYISLQLQAISMAFNTITTESPPTEALLKGTLLSDTAFYSTIVLATFTILFGTRHLNATEHHRGLIQAIAFESVIKLLAILMVGYFSYRLLVGQTEILDLAQLSLQSLSLNTDTSWSKVDFVTRMLLSMAAILFLPRQFHVTVVEADSHKQVTTARWLLPAYLTLVSLVVLPIAISGNTLLPSGTNADLYVLNLPLANDRNLLATLVFIGGLSAATGMVIVAAISLSTMVCNDIVMPMLINIRQLKILQRHDLNRIILTVRRIVIILIMLCSYGYYRLSDTSQGLANIGLLSFAAICQFAPAAIIGLYWQRANRRGAMAGLSLGFITWTYCLLIPNFIGSAELDIIFSSVPWLHPQQLFGLTGLSPLTHGVFWSLALNIGALVIGSVRFEPSLLDKIQASIFLHTALQQQPQSIQGNVSNFASIKDARTLCESIIGERNSQEIFYQYQDGSKPLDENTPVTRPLVQQIEKAIASVIGASSARHVIAKTLLGEDISAEDLVVMMDETSQAISFNREVLEAGFENISQGISVVDKNQTLVAWNSQYTEIFDYPQDFLYVGMPVEHLIRFNAERGECGPGEVEDLVNRRMEHLRIGNPHSYQRQRKDGRYIRSQGNPMPGGGFVTGYTDVTQNIESEEMLRKVNEELEKRVADRTKDLEQLNNQLQQVTESKTRFLAAASHDLLQPINAARLFNQSVRELGDVEDAEIHNLADKVDHSLVSADKLLRALLDISKLDAGSMSPEIDPFDIFELLEELEIELAQLASQKGLELVVRKRHIGIRSDRRLLRSMLQNFISNAIRYTDQGKVLVGCRKRGDKVEIQILDTGIGILEKDQDIIFREFHRVRSTDNNLSEKGLGLGLAITHRLSQILDHPINVESVINKGSKFSIVVPYQAGAIVQNTVRKPWSPSGNLEGLKVLCLENVEEVLEATMLLLSKWNCQATACRSIEQARTALDCGDFDVILADHSLNNEITGLDLLIEARQRGSRCTCIMITAEQDASIRSRAKEHGFYFLPKPVDPSSLRTLLRRAQSDQSESAMDAVVTESGKTNKLQVAG